MRKLLLVMAAAIAFGGVARADTEMPVPVEALKKSVAQAVDQFVIPSYARFKLAADLQRQAYAHLCESPSDDHLVTVQSSFADVIATFSRIEAFRFGPAREDNRFERLLFWPDPRGRGLQQVQSLLLEKDQGAVNLETLQQKSVAVQGLLALDFVLFGTGFESQAGTDGEFRCHYGATIAEAISHVANDLYDGWSLPDGYGDLMKSAGPEDARYKSTGEAMQEFLRAAREQLQIVRDTKLVPVLQDSAKTVKPKLAPFWRSNLTLVSLEGNVAGVTDLVESWSLEKALPGDQQYLADQLTLELETARDSLHETDAGKNSSFESVVRNPEDHARLTYVSIPMTGAITLLTREVPAALGLVAGFNAMDGD